MATLTARQSLRKPTAPAFAWIVRPTARPMGWGDAALRIGTTVYAAECQFVDDDGGCFTIVDLRKADGEHYRLIVSPDGTPSCDCPDAVYRDRPTECKHSINVRAACEAMEAMEREEWEDGLAMAPAGGCPFES